MSRATQFVTSKKKFGQPCYTILYYTIYYNTCTSILYSRYLCKFIRWMWKTAHSATTSVPLVYVTVFFVVIRVDENPLPLPALALASPATVSLLDLVYARTTRVPPGVTVEEGAWAIRSPAHLCLNWPFRAIRRSTLLECDSWDAACSAAFLFRGRQTPICFPRSVRSKTRSRWVVSEEVELMEATTSSRAVCRVRILLGALKVGSVSGISSASDDLIVACDQRPSDSIWCAGVASGAC